MDKIKWLLCKRDNIRDMCFVLLVVGIIVCEWFILDNKNVSSALKLLLLFMFMSTNRRNTIIGMITAVIYGIYYLNTLGVSGGLIIVPYILGNCTNIIILIGMYLEKELDIRGIMRAKIAYRVEKVMVKVIVVVLSLITLFIVADVAYDIIDTIKSNGFASISIIIDNILHGVVDIHILKLTIGILLFMIALYANISHKMELVVLTIICLLSAIDSSGNYMYGIGYLALSLYVFTDVIYDKEVSERLKYKEVTL